MKKNDIIERLTNAGVEHDPKSLKDELVALAEENGVDLTEEEDEAEEKEPAAGEVASKEEVTEEKKALSASTTPKHDSKTHRIMRNLKTQSSEMFSFDPKRGVWVSPTDPTVTLKG